MIDSIILGLATATTVTNLLACAVGVLIGMIVGVLPGIGAMAAISMLFPLTFSMDPTSALVMLAGIYYGSVYGGSTAAILLNVPGTPSGAIACLDGNPMAKQGRGGVALFITAVASFFGASIGIILMMAVSPTIVSVAISFSPAEYFALMCLGLIAATSIAAGPPLRGLAMVLVGILFGTVGMDIYTGIARFNFGTLDLMDGLSLVAVAMGLFGLTEVIESVGNKEVHKPKVERVTMRSMMPSADDWRRFWGPVWRGTGVGSFFGALPGTGTLISAFMAYAVEKRVAKEPQRFGKGAIEGVIAPEAANNAADQTAFIPTMTLGIPGSPTMALMLGALMIHGIAPGPQLMTDRPEMFWGLVMSFWIGNLLLVILNIPLIGIWVKLLTIPYHVLFPAILIFICIGVFSIHSSTFDIWTALIFGFIGYGFRRMNYPPTPLILGFVLGPLLEEHFRRALILSYGEMSTFVLRPVSCGILIAAAALLTWSIWSEYLRKK